MNTFLNQSRWGCEDENHESKSDKALKQRQQFFADCLIVFGEGPKTERLEALERLEWALTHIRPELEKQLGSDFVEITLKDLFKSFNPYPEK